ncbi:uncharacterized protein LOC143034895 [Oratosquilla oratoria]|uniref:uncharacterized protein LOC143034895 n=1 Tax=Oratosquilla oratoria TaxID=337810 RepID=UPI003F76D571
MPVLEVGAQLLPKLPQISTPHNSHCMIQSSEVGEAFLAPFACTPAERQIILLLETVNARALENTRLLHAIQRSGDRQATSTSEEDIEEIGGESALDIPSSNCRSGREAKR